MRSKGSSQLCTASNAITEKFALFLHETTKDHIVPTRYAAIGKVQGRSYTNDCRLTADLLDCQTRSTAYKDTACMCAGAVLLALGSHLCVSFDALLASLYAGATLLVASKGN